MGPVNPKGRKSPLSGLGTALSCSSDGEEEGVLRLYRVCRTPGPWLLPRDGSWGGAQERVVKAPVHAECREACRLQRVTGVDAGSLVHEADAT